MRRTLWVAGVVLAVAAPAAATRTPAAGSVYTVAREFVATAVARRQLDRAWRLAAPSLRGNLTEAQWRTGEIPVTPYPVAEATATYTIMTMRPRDALIEVTFTPRRDSTAEAGLYDIRLHRTGGRWLVAAYRGSRRGCRPGGARDPDPGTTNLWC